MDTRIPPLRIKIVLESNPLKSIMLVGRLAVVASGPAAARCRPRAARGMRQTRAHALLLLLLLLIMSITIIMIIIRTSYRIYKSNSIF